jgi:hypothetical protein
MKPRLCVDEPRSHLRQPFTCYIMLNCVTDPSPPRGVTRARERAEKLIEAQFYGSAHTEQMLSAAPAGLSARKGSSSQLFLDRLISKPSAKDYHGRSENDRCYGKCQHFLPTPLSGQQRYEKLQNAEHCNYDA